jgi:signal transduction histidine kinase
MASSEFVALCQSQVALLTQGLGAALSAIYLTEELVESGDAKLIPIVVYPETGAVWEENRARWRLADATGRFDQIRRLPSGKLQPSSRSQRDNAQISSTQPDGGENALGRQRQIVLPLMHEGTVMGLLVTGRDDRPWNDGEKLQIERIAQTLAIACIMDRQREWLEHQVKLQQRLQAQQRDLMDDLLHQFRNPLTAIRTFGKLLIRRLRPGDANREVANSIVRESDRLQELLQQFDQAIDLTAANSAPREQLPPTTPQDNRPIPLLPYTVAGSQPQSQSCQLAEILEPLLDSARAIAQERNLVLVANIPPNLPSVQTNAKALREVLNNLIDNALKYTPAGGNVYIDVGKEKHCSAGDFQAIAITDTGPGIPPQDKEHLFERHYRGVQAQTEIPGTGLGLAIARELVQQMKGEIQVISPAYDAGTTDAHSLDGRHGTTFIVWLPLAKF